MEEKTKIVKTTVTMGGDLQPNCLAGDWSRPATNKSVSPCGICYCLNSYSIKKVIGPRKRCVYALPKRRRLSLLHSLHPRLFCSLSIPLALFQLYIFLLPCPFIRASSLALLGFST